jgi:hypothetical protein
MNRDEHYGTATNDRRHQRYELGTELTADILGVERRETIRGRSLNIKEGGIAGVFATFPLASQQIR